MKGGEQRDTRQKRSYVVKLDSFPRRQKLCLGGRINTWARVETTAVLRKRCLPTYRSAERMEPGWPKLGTEGMVMSSDSNRL